MRTWIRRVAAVAAALALPLGGVPVLALGQSASAPAPTPVASAPLTFAQIPGVTVEYYDVEGKTVEAIQKSIEAQRPKDASGKTIPARASWSIGTNVRQEKTTAQCKVLGATTQFTGKAIMPRLKEKGVPSKVLKQWRVYVAGLEQQQAATLRIPYERLGEVEQAVKASSCEGAQQAADRVIATIQADTARAAAPPPAAAAPAKQR